MVLRMKNFNIFRVHCKIQLLRGGEGLEKPRYRVGGIAKKGGLGQFVDLRRGLGKKEGVVLFEEGVDTLMPTILGLIKHDMINLFYYEH